VGKIYGIVVGGMGKERRRCENERSQQLAVYFATGREWEWE